MVRDNPKIVIPASLEKLLYVDGRPMSELGKTFPSF